MNFTLVNFYRIDHKYKMKFEGYTYNVSNFSIDLSSRFENNYKLECPLTNYKISKVIDGYSSIDETVQFGNLFSIASNGTFQIDEYFTPYYRYKICISAYNGFKWSDCQTTGWLIEMSFINGIPNLPEVAPFFYELPKKVTLQTAETAGLMKSYNRLEKSVLS